MKHQLIKARIAEHPFIAESDISGVAPGKKDIQLKLAETEGTRGVERGTIAWLSSGLRIEETQYVVFAVH